MLASINHKFENDKYVGLVAALIGSNRQRQRGLARAEPCALKGLLPQDRTPLGYTARIPGPCASSACILCLGYICSPRSGRDRSDVIQIYELASRTATRAT